MTDQTICDRCGDPIRDGEQGVEIRDRRGIQSHGVRPHNLDGHLCLMCANNYDVDIYEVLFGEEPETEPPATD